MAFIQTNPERVKSCFQDPRVKYAAGRLLPAASIKPPDEKTRRIAPFHKPWTI